MRLEALDKELNETRLTRRVEKTLGTEQASDLLI